MTKTVDGVEYKRQHKPRDYSHCTGCVGHKNSDLCEKFTEPCGSENFIWVKVEPYKDKVKMKGHLVSALVNELKSACYTNTELQSLRQTISEVVHKYIEPY